MIFIRSLAANISLLHLSPLPRYGTHVLLESARLYGKIRRFINVSTDEVYGETSLGKDEGLTEASPLEPTNPYSAAKAGAEMMARAYHTSYKLPVIVTRGNNVYGPHQFPEKMIPKFILRASRGESLPIHGDGLAVRSYLYVDDVAEAYILVLLKGTVREREVDLVLGVAGGGGVGCVQSVWVRCPKSWRCLPRVHNKKHLQMH